MRVIWKKLLPLFLVLSMLCSVSPVAFAAMESGTGYRVTGSYNSEDDTFTASIYVHDLNALGGRFALGFDPDKLELPPTTNYLSDTITRGTRIELTGEGKTAPQLISQERGHVLFSWYPYGSAVEALDGEYLIASVTFQLKDGVSPENFDSRTLYLYCVAGNYMDWDTSAWVRGTGLVDYSNCVAGVQNCDVAFEYPNSDIQPSGMRTVQIIAKDSAGSTLRGGEVLLESSTVQVDASGSALFHLPDGTYSCLVTAPGYEDKVASVEVYGGNVYRMVQLRSMQQLVDDVAAALEIGFQGEDSADYVTRDMIFPTKGDQNTQITWASSAPDLVSAYGNVFRISQEADVTVTATVSKDGRSASRQFKIHLTAKEVPPTVGPEDEPKEEEGKPSPSPFTDVDSVASWAGEAINAMYALGIVKGTGANTFSPGSPVTRADFVTLLMRMFRPEGTPGAGFSDVAQGAYYHDPVVLAQGLGIAQGVESNKFGPTGNITRQDMITLTYRAMQKLGYPLTTQYGDVLLDAYPDSGSVADYAREAMAAMLASGYINGKGDVLAPGDNTTRAEAAVFLYRIYENVLGGEGG